ncbi:hypothetical protein BH09PSE5_BH09PSE5_32340 [soil metagenome]
MTAFMQVPPTGAYMAHVRRPSAPLQITNFVIAQAAWFAAVLGAAKNVRMWGAAAVVLCTVPIPC